MRHRSWSIISPLLTAVIIVSCELAGGWGQATTAHADESTSFDRATLLFLAPSGPLLADLRISVARMPYRQWVAQFLTRQLDLDQSETLTADELQLLPARLRASLGDLQPIQMIRQAARDSTVDAVDTRSFALWMRHALRQSFEISATSATPDDAVRLTDLLDTNQDGTVDQQELTTASYSLRFRDLDNDQTWSISELLPYRDPLTQSASIAPDVARLPFQEITDAPSAQRAAEMLVRRYGSDDQIDKSVLRLASNTADSAMSTGQLAEWLQKPEFHATVHVQLSDLANRSDVKLEIAPHAQSFCTAGRREFGSATLTVDATPFQIVARGGGSNNRAYLKGFLGQNFTMYDADKNQYLDEMELGAMSAVLTQAGVTVDFKAIDGNQDGMIVRDELFRYADREQTVQISQIEVTVQQDGKTLFSLLDGNEDRRLTVRELSQGLERLRAYDTAGTQRFTDQQLGTEYQLQVGLGRAQVRRNNSRGLMGMQMQNQASTDAILPGAESLAGPEWFRRMDRNQDGDVSLREFPGTLAMFRELDQDMDNLISSDEAAALSGEASPEPPAERR